MFFQKMVSVVDCHTEGEPARIVTGGIPIIIGNTMADKRQYLKENLDNFRKFVIFEPRGHNDMFGAIITSPCNPEADIGVIFMDTSGYLNMCGHGSIAVVTVAIETGMIPAVEPYTEVKMDTPSGLVTGIAKINNGVVEEVTIENVPSFLFKKNAVLKRKNGKKIVFDIAFGGSFFALVPISQLGLTLDLNNVPEIKTIGMELLGRINTEFDVIHPTLPHINTIDLIEFYDEVKTDTSDARNAVVFGNCQIDRSPCGTGTSAKIATLVAKNKLGLNEKYVYESILGSKFTAEAVRFHEIGDIKAVIPRITGRAFITGIQSLVVSKNDPFPVGFKI